MSCHPVTDTLLPTKTIVIQEGGVAPPLLYHRPIMFRSQPFALAAAMVAFALLPTEGRAIIGGAQALPGEFPWIAGIVQKNAIPSPGLVGGGALVGDQWVVTAAHSVNGIPAESLEVWLDLTDLNSSSRQVRGVLAVFFHPDFASADGTSVNDIALLLLDQPAGGIATLPVLADPDGIAVDDDVRVAGWGTTTAGFVEATPQLQKAAARILSQEEASSAFGSVIEPVHLPAVDPDELATPCVGDSGGPLVKNIEGTDRLVGLVSFGNVGCDDPSLPAIYTRVPLFAEWMEAYLALTAPPSRLLVSGRGKRVLQGKAPRTSNGTDYGVLKRRGARRTRTFRLENAGAGLLTVRAVTVSGRFFALVKRPSTLVSTGAVSTARVRFRASAAKRRHQGRVRLFTNDPAAPVFTFRIAGRVR